jgi:hypothetical protein
MKPKIETVDQSKNRESFALRADPTFPLTDQNYHSVALGGYNGHCARTDAPSFRSISGDYFKNEAPNDFLGEVLFFVAFVLTTVPALMSGAYALAHFVRAIGAV